LKNEREELSCILLGCEHSCGSEEYTAYCNRKERNSVVWLKEKLQKLKGFESGMDKGVTFMLGHIKMLQYTPLNCMETRKWRMKILCKKIIVYEWKNSI
jgi:hypothetical protein